jgi:flagellar biosynthesis component FlhA
MSIALKALSTWLTPTGFIQPDTPDLQKQYEKLREAIKQELTLATPQEDEIYTVVIESKGSKHLAEAYYQDGTWYYQHFNSEIQGKVTIV